MKVFLLNNYKRKLLVLLILYLGFISLGLPDQVLGIAWPSMRSQFDKSLEAAGILVFCVAILTASSSFCSGYFIKRFSTSTILITSGFLTMSGLLGYGLSQTWLQLIICTIPLGIGAGAIDASLNDYVAKNYPSKHMNWLHGCWGIGAAMGPAIMSYSVVSNASWRNGYIIIAGIQVFLVLFFILTAKMWKKSSPREEIVSLVKKDKILSLAPMLSIFMFFIYTCIESSIGVWFYSVLIEQRAVSTAVAGTWIVLYWSFLTLGRFVIGAISNRLGNRKLINYGIYGAIISLCFLLWNNETLNILSLCTLGFSLAGLYPSMMHETPRRFSSKLAATLTGYQVGMAALGVAILTPLVGVIISNIGLNYLIPILLFLTFIMLVMNKILDART